MAKGKKKTAKREKAASAKAKPFDMTPEEIEENGIKTGEDAYRILRRILERQDGNNAPGDGDELYAFCEAFKALDEHMRTASGSGPKIWRNT